LNSAVAQDLGKVLFDIESLYNCFLKLKKTNITKTGLWKLLKGMKFSKESEYYEDIFGTKHFEYGMVCYWTEAGKKLMMASEFKDDEK